MHLDIRFEKISFNKFVSYWYKVHSKKQNYGFFILLNEGVQIYCLDYNHQGSITLRYLSSYDTCENERCLPVCTKFYKNNQKSVVGLMIPFLVPDVVLKNHKLLGQQIKLNYDFKSKNKNFSWKQKMKRKNNIKKMLFIMNYLRCEIWTSFPLYRRTQKNE